MWLKEVGDDFFKIFDWCGIDFYEVEFVVVIDDEGGGDVFD